MKWKGTYKTGIRLNEDSLNFVLYIKDVVMVQSNEDDYNILHMTSIECIRSLILIYQQENI